MVTDTSATATVGRSARTRTTLPVTKHGLKFRAHAQIVPPGRAGADFAKLLSQLRRGFRVSLEPSLPRPGPGGWPIP